MPILSKKEKMIIYPYLPNNRTIFYVDENNMFMQEAKKILAKSGCSKQPTGAVVVKNSQIIGYGTNSGKLISPCPRVTAGFQTGKGYHLCKEICSQKGHAEAMAVNNALSNQKDTKEADLYLYGHWWCCQDCWKIIISAGIKQVYLLTKSWELFN